MLVTREADYAIRCVLEVARNGRISAAQVARLQGISPTFLGKIVQSLARAGILSTRRGVGGGISLAVPIEDITMLQVIEAVEGPLCLNDCLSTPPQCPLTQGCPVYPFLRHAQVELKALLDVSLAEMVESPPGAEPNYELVLAAAEAASPNGSGHPEATAVAPDVPVGGED